MAKLRYGKSYAGYVHNWIGALGGCACSRLQRRPRARVPHARQRIAAGRSARNSDDRRNVIDGNRAKRLHRNFCAAHDRRRAKHSARNAHDVGRAKHSARSAYANARNSANRRL